MIPFMSRQHCLLVLAIVWLILLSGNIFAQSPKIGIAGESVYEPHKMVRLSAEGVPARSLLTWSVTPSESVEYPSQLAADKMEFNALPGDYLVTLIVDWRTGAGMQSETVTKKVTLKGCSPEQAPPPKPMPKTPQVDTVQAMAAIGRINFDGAGCTAAAVWPRRPDGRWDLYTAAHCLGRVGQKGRFALKDGRVLPVTVTVIDRRSDAAWLVTDEAIPELPFLVLAEKVPARGAGIWHAGFGWDRPGNREEGEIVTPSMPDGKISFNLNLSQGDSGGPIMLQSNNEIIASACCTTRIAAKALAFGGNCETAWRLRPKVPQTVQDDPEKWAPAHMMTVDEDGRILASDSFQWKPAPIPLVKLNDKGEPVMIEGHKKD